MLQGAARPPLALYSRCERQHCFPHLDIRLPPPSYGQNSSFLEFYKHYRVTSHSTRFGEDSAPGVFFIRHDYTVGSAISPMTRVTDYEGGCSLLLRGTSLCDAGTSSSGHLRTIRELVASPVQCKQFCTSLTSALLADRLHSPRWWSIRGPIQTQQDGRTDAGTKSQIDGPRQG